MIEDEIQLLRENSRRHVGCESIRDEHAKCDVTIDSIRQQLEESEETIAALKLDVQRLALENHHSDEMSIIKRVNEDLTHELQTLHNSEATLKDDLKEAQHRINVYKYDAETLDGVSRKTFHHWP